MMSIKIHHWAFPSVEFCYNKCIQPPFHFCQLQFTTPGTKFSGADTLQKKLNPNSSLQPPDVAVTTVISTQYVLVQNNCYITHLTKAFDFLSFHVGKFKNRVEISFNIVYELVCS